MNISKYSGYFHDGSILSIRKNNTSIIIYMESSEVDPDEVQHVLLTNRRTIKGFLHFVGVESVTINEKLDDKDLARFYNYEIMHLEVSEKSADIELFSWDQEGTRSQDYVVVHIKANQIYWENYSEINSEESPDL